MESSRLSPWHVVPRGSHVVLRRDVFVLGGERDERGRRRFKKAGSVGEVAEAPITNEYAYVVGFADGSEVRVRRADFTVRRSDAPEAVLPDREVEEFSELVIYEVVVGSVAYGLTDEGSDVDLRGVYLPPAEWHWSLQPLPEQVEFKRLADGTVADFRQRVEGTDVCWWELAKFLRLALKANPNVLEVLFVDEAHVLRCNDLGAELRRMRHAFLSKYLFQTYSGYVLSQFKRMKKAVESGRPFRTKHAMHLIRLLYSGIAAVSGSGIQVDAGEHRDELLAIKRGEVPFEKILDHALALDRRFQDAFETTALPDRPDVEMVDRFLIAARRSVVS